MKYFITLLILALAFQSCKDEETTATIEPVNWDDRIVTTQLPDSLLQSGATYLSVYSHIYSETDQKIHQLTATASLRNTSRSDTLYIEKAQYFDTQGRMVRSYLDTPIYIAPLETLEIVIGERDVEGGAGANFIFDWKLAPGTSEPLFECVMISTYGQQGLSFTTQGKRIE